MAKQTFERYIGIDYSGAKTPGCSLPGLRVYEAVADSAPVEVQPPPSPRKYWTRRSLAEWLIQELRKEKPRTIVGIDHAFSFPLQYFKSHGLPKDWPSFLEDFHAHWPTDEGNTYVCFVRDGLCGNGSARTGNTRWKRVTDLRAGSAKSPFHFDVPGSVATSTHAGLPWLHRMRLELQGRVHFWPFDGWEIPNDRSAIVEVYPALWSRGFPKEGRNNDQHDAFSVAAWMQQADRNGTLAGFFNPSLPKPERAAASIEGWILGLK